MPPKPSYTKDDIDRVVALHQAFVKKKDILAQTGLTIGVVQKIIARFSPPVDRKLREVARPRDLLVYTAEQYSQAVELRKQGMSLKDIEAKTGIKHGSLKAKFSELGLKLTHEQLSRIAQHDPGTDQRVVKLRQLGHPRKDIAKRLKVPESRVKTILVNNPTPVQRPAFTPIHTPASSSPSEDVMELYRFVTSLGLETRFSDYEAIGQELSVFVPLVRLGIRFNGLYVSSSACPSFRRSGNYNTYLACLNHKLNLFAFFEDEWKNKRPLIEEMLRIRCQKFQGEVLDARKLEVVHLEKNAQFKPFFDANHLDGHARASSAWGLIHNGTLVMATSLRTNFNGETEIVRMATAIGYRVRGGAGRLISKMPRPLVSFSNNRLSSGGVYKALGFELLSQLKSSYWYTDFNTRVWRFRCKRDNRPEVIAEFPTEILQATGGVFSETIFGDRRPLYRIEDYGHQKWLLK